MDISNNKSKRVQTAMKLFDRGFKCSQAVLVAFEDLHHMDYEVALKLSSSFGAGMGKLGEVCGAVTGMFMVAGLLYGFSYPLNQDEINNHFERIQELTNEFKSITGSILCVKYPSPNNCKDDSPCMEIKKNQDCCQQISSTELVGIATYIMENYINENPLNIN